MHLLKGNTNFIEKFRKDWTCQTQWGNTTQIRGNPEVTYGYSDFDADILTEADLAELKDFGKTEKPVEKFKEIMKKRKNPYKHTTASEEEYFREASWISMRRKGEILIESFNEQFVPLIEQVISTQKPARVVDPFTGDIIQGYIDMVLKIKGYDKPVIFDLKTASRPYTQDQVELTDQLTLYAAMEAKKHNTDLVGYVVLVKNIPKEVNAFCKKCGHQKTSTHKTCPNTIKGTRCKGDWQETKKVAPKVQVMVETKTKEQVGRILDDHYNIVHAMKSGVIYRNLNKCYNWYGGKCPFFDACHNNDYTGLQKRGKK